MANIGLGELFVIVLIGLLVFGPNKLPEMMRNVGKGLRAFQQETQKATSILREGLDGKPPPPAQPPATAAGVVDVPDADAVPQAPASAQEAPPPAAGQPPPPAGQPPSSPSESEPLDPGVRLHEDT